MILKALMIIICFIDGTSGFDSNNEIYTLIVVLVGTSTLAIINVIVHS